MVYRAIFDGFLASIALYEPRHVYWEAEKQTKKFKSSIYYRNLKVHKQKPGIHNLSDRWHIERLAIKLLDTSRLQRDKSQILQTY